MAHCLMHLEANTMEQAFERQTLFQGGVASRHEAGLSNLSPQPRNWGKMKGFKGTINLETIWLVLN